MTDVLGIYLFYGLGQSEFRGFFDIKKGFNIMKKQIFESSFVLQIGAVKLEDAPYFPRPFMTSFGFEALRE
jgi:hypothetical protein